MLRIATSSSLPTGPAPAATRIARTAAAAALAALLTVPGSRTLAQPQAPAPLPPEHLSWYGDPGAPDVSGIWVRADAGGQAPAPGTASKSKEGWMPWPPPLQPPFLATWQTHVTDAAAGKRIDDPVRSCLPPGMPRFITGTNGPLQIIQTPGRVTMYRDGDPVRRIWLDGRPLPKSEDLESFFNGTAAGRYEGKDLVVDVAGIKDQPIDSTGVPHSDDLKVTERYRRVDAKTLNVEITLTDPAAYSQPMTTTATYKTLDNPLWEPTEFICTPVTNYHPDLYVR